MSVSVSIVVPLLDEQGNVRELVRQIRTSMAGQGRWELILVDDGSTDDTGSLMKQEASSDPRIRAVRLARRYGQSTATQAGFDRARGDVVVTLDGDLQNDPEDIPILLRKLEEGYDLVVGYRVGRMDRWLTRKVPSWCANRVIRWLTGVPIRDNGCSLKAYRRDLLERLRLYSDMHRFIPALAVGIGAARVTEIPVRHRPRATGQAKYGLSRVVRVLADLITVKMIRSFRHQPLHLFSLMAGWSALIGAIAGVAALMVRPDPARAVVFPGVALLWFTLAAFLLFMGLVGESIIRRPARSVESPLVREVQA
jgi:glycosyltransferase involved in cell wall biosynthesis